MIIGDGMGLSQISSLYALEGLGRTNFERFPIVGLLKNSSSSHKITDSAAGATAYACGVKSYNGAIGVDADTSEVGNIVEILSNEGWETGLVVTSSITHATPASFFAHHETRENHEMIASQLHGSPIDFFAGGGRKFFDERMDWKNYVDSLRASGIDIRFTWNQVRQEEIKTRIGFLLASDGMPKVSEGRGDFLMQASVKAIDFLKTRNENFFLMVEGSQIDWGGHENDSGYVVNEMADFNKMLGAVLDFASRDGETLVIVTADHETGGFALSATGEGDNANYNLVEGSFTTENHTATMIPLFAYGPGSQNFQGIYENNEVFHKILELVKDD